MDEFQYEGEPVIVSRDAGYNIAELLTLNNRKKARERVNNPNYINSKYELKDLFGEFGVIVIPEAMTYIHPHDF